MEQTVILLALSASVFFVTVLLVLAIFWKEEDPARMRVEALRGDRREPTDLSVPFTDRMVAPFLDNIAEKLLAALPHRLLTVIETKLVTAGQPLTLNGYLLATAASVAAFGAAAIALLVAARAQLQVQQLAAVVALGAVGALLPYFWLQSRIRGRQKTIVRSLPDSLDLITTCVEAGLGLDAALSRVAEKVQGPFAEELAQTLREIGLGRHRRDALLELGRRTGVSDLITFVNAIVQAEEMGTSIGQVLRVQADQMRIRRRQRAEEEAHKAPVKMVFPLALCIFPTLFVVILGPGAITVFQTFMD
jgi:tight adherence protein C